MKKIEIRKATTFDAPRVQELSHQLGYNLSVEEIQKNILSIENKTDYETVVITVDDNTVGWMSLNLRFAIELSPYLQITAIVVDESRRNMGLGKLLLDYAKKSARQNQVSRISLYSNNLRTAAHEFYLKANFKRLKESSFFTLEL